MGLEQLQEEGGVRHIGVSNFTVDILESLLQEAGVVPLVNQVEFHPQFFDKDLYHYCREQHILMKAWSPLMQGEAFANKVLGEVGRKYGKSAAQVALRWCVDMGTVPLPKTKTPSRMRENIAIFDFALNADDMAAIHTIATGKRRGPDPATYHSCPQKPSA